MGKISLAGLALAKLVQKKLDSPVIPNMSVRVFFAGIYIADDFNKTHHIVPSKTWQIEGASMDLLVV